jgi:hypothetical protein
MTRNHRDLENGEHFHTWNTLEKVVYHEPSKFYHVENEMNSYTTHCFHRQARHNKWPVVNQDDIVNHSQ